MFEGSPSLILVAFLALVASPGIAAADQRVEIGEQLFAFDLPDDWHAIPEPSLPEAFRWGFQHGSRSDAGDLPLILVDYQPLQITPDTPKQWQRAIAGQPTYDAARHLITSSVPLEGGAWKNAVVRGAVFFGRSGAAIIYFVSAEQEAERYRAEFDHVVDTFAFDPRYAWRPYFGWRLAAAGALVALLAVLGIRLQRRFTRDLE